MKTGFIGTFVISWSQTELDGLASAPTDALRMGAVWSWHGDSLRLDGPTELLRLEVAEGEADMRRRAARSVRRLVGAAVDPGAATATGDETVPDRSFVITDGMRRYTATLIEAGAGRLPLLMFVDELPPRDADLWIVHLALDVGQAPKPQEDADSGLICFTPGTLIDTPSGACPVEHLSPGDVVQTRDNGPQKIRWIGARRMSGARLFVYPGLRPIRLRAGALASDRPEGDLLVSPEHRLLLRGGRVRALFNTPEVLVAARDLINGTSIAADTQLREVTYIHLLFEEHQVLWANGVESESFHPANASLTALSEGDRQRLQTLLPGVDENPLSYGAFARRNLTASEAAILRHEAA
ncbi:hemolysin-type calcium-binding protein [Phaeobacter gallaeciensis]|uniref:Hemolysin-type calcium-binding protein n=1 Tax=Phaeobacter gallaeciensis TaxID=60890 RepID=A0A1B0ZVE7_9RHOB|nr:MULTISPECIES: Hint domain-containing protein [Phaeobacter]MDF1771534.1 Hint domain-containing protein [Pseudophaeobacter sp. bin_em_oilr2.035]MEE2633415.1 Hint domain-containing protein [Pseudomonadota bacterium]ANP38156.1 hemolysin-type calcium-binding protein [Phaeobacter gallaeciensis]MDE4062852.1 Hint domain-containing protein [Phaeobacter gallaeciensis]MDE4125834.1 Hint domain-containing protein [Phaeobacter gallaeciensis]